MLRAFRERDVRIPDDISVIVFDEHPIAGYLAPALTTIKMPLREMGALATRMLIGSIMGETHAQTVMVEAPSELVERASVAPCRGGR
jgi:DNA-binding LacI/PurR family transcriptional regulator